MMMMILFNLISLIYITLSTSISSTSSTSSTSTSSTSSKSSYLQIDIDKCTTIISGKWTGPKPLRNPISPPSIARLLENENDLIPGTEQPGDETSSGPIFPIGEGGPMVTHTADCSDCDFRLAKVPAKDWPVGSQRPLYLYKGEYPSTISERSSTWSYKNLEGIIVIIIFTNTIQVNY
jgi:hypothetical protein